MANFGKFIDRSPLICPAGKQTAENLSVDSCLKEYALNDSVDAVKHEAGIFKDPPMQYKQQRMKNFRNLGTNDQIKECLHPPPMTHFQTLINDLKETSYRSFWELEQGRSKDPLGSLPSGMEPLEVTFGRPTNREVTMKELVNPSKTHYEVLWDSQVGHEMYKKTHCDFNPGERVTRDYAKPPYDPEKRYGMTTTYDPRGIQVRCLCKWHLSNPIFTLSSRQADFVQKTRYKLGAALEPNKNIESVPKGHSFGNVYKLDLYGMKDLLKDPDVEPCTFKRDFDEWIAHLNYMRSFIKRRRHFGLCLEDLFDKILNLDREKSGWVSLELFYEMCACDHVNFNRKYLEALLEFLGYTHEGCLFYRAVIDLLDLDKPMPVIKKIDDVPEKNLYYISTAAAASCDYLLIDNSNMPSAGSLTRVPWPVRPEGGCIADNNSLGSETIAEHVLYPSIYTNYGLSHRDFFKPRRPEVIRTLFEKIGYEFSEGSFEKLWKVALELDKTGLVCVDTFYNLLQECAPALSCEGTAQE